MLWFLLLMTFSTVFSNPLLAGNSFYSFNQMLEGHRLTVTNIEIIKQKGKTIHMYADIVNTGRFDIVTGKGKRLPYLKIEFDQTIEQNKLEDYSSAIIEKVKRTNMKIGIGETRNRLFMRVKPIKKLTPINDQPLANSDEEDKTIIETADESLSEPMASMDTMIPSDTKDSKKIVEVEIEKNTAKTEVPKSKPTPKKDKKKKKKKRNKKEDEGVVFESPTFESKSLDDILKEKEECPDLVIEELEIVKVKSKKATVRFKVRNIGLGPAKIYDMDNKDENPLGVRAYISGSDKITKGAINIGGFFMEGGLDETDGYLKTNESFGMEVVLDIKKKTRYMPLIVLSLDAFLKLRECDRTNNSKHVEIK